MFISDVEEEFYPRTSTPCKNHLRDEEVDSFVIELTQFPTKFVVHGVQNIPEGILCGNIMMGQSTEKSGRRMALKRKREQKKEGGFSENVKIPRQKYEIRHMRL